MATTREQSPYKSPAPSIPDEPSGITRGQWMALAAALLGWMFDGLEIGLFPLAARPCLQDLLGGDADVGLWFGVITAGFLVGAATGGVLFGWLGDRLGRVRAMMLSVCTYAIFSGLCGFAATAGQVAACRFVASLGMGGEWSLGVALVMEVWPNRSRGFLAGLIGAAANVGFLLIAVVGLGLTTFIDSAQSLIESTGMPQGWVDALFAHSAWRLLMMLGATPAVLTVLIRLFVPESEKWQKEHAAGGTSHWAARDLLGVVFGALGPCAIIYVWADEEASMPLRLGVTAIGLIAATVGYTYPVIRYLQRAALAGRESSRDWRQPLGRMLLGACLGGVALLGTWGSLQWATPWADELADGMPQAKAYTQISSAIGAIIGTILAALMGDWFGRRVTYFMLCVASLASAAVLFQLNTAYNAMFLASVFVAGMCTASFYGWLPLYLPELFRTSVRATGQGFSYNFGRILAAVGSLQTGYLMSNYFGNSFPKACSVTSLIYVVGMVVIWFAPETRGKPLPD
ncbi:MAG TPA: MFS transporter [Pirellulales bacterium]|nr:MFS transporter [Pirellulales bacterium]